MRTRVLLLTIGGLVGGCEKVALWLWATLPELDSILLSSRATAPQFMVCDRPSARSRAPMPVRKNYLAHAVVHTPSTYGR
jgi:hypothetical protein